MRLLMGMGTAAALAATRIVRIEPEAAPRIEPKPQGPNEFDKERMARADAKRQDKAEKLRQAAARER